MDAGQHLDRVALSELQQVMGAEFSLLVETFINDCVLRIEAIKEAVEAANYDALRRAAHSFKGSTGNMGAIQLTELCRALEELGHSGQTEGALEILGQITIEYQQVKRALESL